MKPFLISYGVFVLGLAALLFFFSKTELFIILNGSYTNFGDMVFPYITRIGSGYLSLMVTITFLFFRYRLAVIGACSFLLTGVVTQMMKHFVFADSLRPYKFFENSGLIHTVSDVQMHSFHSFPSGHSATAFSLCFMLALILDKRYQLWGLLFALIAMLIGYSRIYLGQHFPEDILGGSLIGVMITWGCYQVLNKQLLTTAWADKSLFRMMKSGT